MTVPDKPGADEYRNMDFSSAAGGNAAQAGGSLACSRHDKIIELSRLKIDLKPLILSLIYRNVNSIIAAQLLIYLRRHLAGQRLCAHRTRAGVGPFNQSRQSIMKISAIGLLAISVLVTGCASVSMAPKEESAKAKEFKQPSANTAGLYIYRNSFAGKALKKDLWVDGKCIGESAPDVFFYTEVEGGKSHKIDTESEFSPNTLELTTDAGKNYYVRQYIKMGVLVGGAGVEQVSEEQGKKDIAPLELATQGHCSAAT